MASQRFLVLINNAVLRDRDGNPIYEVITGGKVVYTNNKGNNDLKEYFEEMIEVVQAQEAANPLYEILDEHNVIVRQNSEFRLRMYMTAFYQLMIKIAKKPNARFIGTSSIDIQDYWPDLSEQFYLEEFFKYSDLTTYLENLVRSVRPKSSPFSIKNNGRNVMAILHLEIPGLFNPLLTVPGIKDKLLFADILGDGDKRDIDLMDPVIFIEPIFAGKINCHFATSSDIMHMCGVKFKDQLNSRDIYRLLSSICIRRMFPSDGQTNKVDHLRLYFPLDETVHQIFHTKTKVPVATFATFEEADTYLSTSSLEEELHEIVTVNSVISFINSSFPRLRRERITFESEIYHTIRGADFID